MQKLSWLREYIVPTTYMLILTILPFYLPLSKAPLFYVNKNEEEQTFF